MPIQPTGDLAAALRTGDRRALARAVTLVESTRASLNGQTYPPNVMPHPYAFNLFSHNTAIDPATGYNEEETKVIKETRKIFEDEEIAIGVTCVRVPVLRAHCEAITFECERPITEDQVRAILTRAPGVKIVAQTAIAAHPVPSVVTFTGSASAGERSSS